MKRWMIPIFLMMTVLLAGCGSMDTWTLSKTPRTEYTPAPQPPAVVQQDASQMQRRFDAGGAQQGDAVQSAVMWAQKYEELSIANNDLREKNNKLFLENSQLVQQVDKLKLQLEQTQKELSEANEFLQQMHVELNKWKSDVLGFRDEMRQAQKAQLEALGKILRVLGAEPINTQQ